jgi:hypothetical protein
LLQVQEGTPMVSMNLSPRIYLSSRECDGRAVVALRGELDVAGAVGQAAGSAGRSRLMAGPVP